MNRMKKPYLLAVAALVVFLGLFGARAFFSGGEPAPAAADAPPVAVETAAARLDDLAEPMEIGGTVRARNTAVIVSRVVAEVHAVRVRPGDRVKAGQALVVLDARELQASEARARATMRATEQGADLAGAERDGAQAALALAQATHRRIADLHARKSATPHELDEAVAGLRAAEARARSAEARLAEAGASIEAARAAARAADVAASYATLTAPFDGVVTEKLMEPGNMAVPGAPLLTVEDARGFRLEVRVDESRVGSIALAQPVEVLVEASAVPGTLAAPMTGRVAEIERTLDAGSHAFVVKIDLPTEAPLRSGMFGRARFAGPGRRALVIPATSVVRQGQIASVFVVGSDGRARLRMLSAGDPAGARVEVRAGLAEGERVVVAPPPGLVDGRLVRQIAARQPAPGGHETKGLPREAGPQ
jgi:multidrug efflux pump subunit AcrA (membrane-fusion protein)